MQTPKKSTNKQTNLKNEQISHSYQFLQLWKFGGVLFKLFPVIKENGCLECRKKIISGLPMTLLTSGKLYIHW